MDRELLYLKTAFCCVACDGEIAPEEMETIKTLPHFKEIDLQNTLSDYVDQLHKNGNAFLKKYLAEIKEANLTEAEELELVNIAIHTIEIDKSVEYKEVAFFKKIRKRLHVSDERLLASIQDNPDVIDQITPQDYLLPDITDDDDLSLWDDTFNDIRIM